MRVLPVFNIAPSALSALTMGAKPFAPGTSARGRADLLLVSTNGQVGSVLRPAHRRTEPSSCTPLQQSLGGIVQHRLGNQEPGSAMKRVGADSPFPSPLLLLSQLVS